MELTLDVIQGGVQPDGLVVGGYQYRDTTLTSATFPLNNRPTRDKASSYDLQEQYCGWNGQQDREYGQQPRYEHHHCKRQRPFASIEPYPTRIPGSGQGLRQ